MPASADLHWKGTVLKGIVFDLDGTLTDSNEVYYRLFRDATADAGIPVRREDVWEPLAEGLDLWDHAIPIDIPDRHKRIEQIKRTLAPVFREALRHVQPLPGVGEVLKALQERKLKLGLVTDSGRYALRPLEDRSLAHYFESIVTRDDGLPRKPQPDGILECLRTMDIDPGNAIIVGDSLLDIRAGRAAGTLTVGVLTGLASRRQLEAEAPTALVEDLTGLLTILDAKSLSDPDGPGEG